MGGVVTKGVFLSGAKHMKRHLMNSREWVVVTGESIRALELKMQEDQVVDRVGKAIQVKDLLLPFQEMVLGDQVISND